jgi:putative flippase GtrA
MEIPIIIKKMLSFATIGALLTVVSLGSTTIGIKFFHTPLKLTYVLVNIVTIIMSFYLNSKFTFKNEISFLNSIKYFAIYLTSMGLGTYLLDIFDSFFKFEKWIFPFMALPFTMVYNFTLSSIFLGKKDFETKELIETEVQA